MGAEGHADFAGAFVGHPVSCEKACVRNGRLWMEGEGLPCAARAPPVMLCVISLSPGLLLSIFAGVVCLYEHFAKEVRMGVILWNTCST